LKGMTRNEKTSKERAKKANTEQTPKEKAVKWKEFTNQKINKGRRNHPQWSDGGGGGGTGLSSK